MTYSKKQKVPLRYNYTPYGGFAFLLAPIRKYRVLGHSMEPALKNGDEVIVNRLSYLFSSPKIGEVVALIDEEMKVYIKRIKKIQGKKYFTVGDNPSDSRDSRNFGWIEKGDIIGKVIFTR